MQGYPTLVVSIIKPSTAVTTKRWVDMILTLEDTFIEMIIHKL